MKRIFIGTRDIANNPNMLKAGLEGLGFECDVGLRVTNHFYNSLLDPRIDKLYKEVRTRIARRETLDDLEELLSPYLNYDCYIFVTESLLPGQLDLPILRKLGKEVIFLFTGTDVRYSNAAERFYQSFNDEFPESLKSTLLNDYTTHQEMALQDVYRDRYSNKLNTTRIAEYYASSCLGNPRSLHFAIAPYFTAAITADTSECIPRIPNRNHPKIIHCPSKRAFKKTNLIIEKLNELRDEGITFDFEIVENQSHDVVLSKLADADVLIDQIFPGKSALLGIEGMASGCAVLGCNTELAMPFPYRVQPIVGITTQNLKQRLRNVLSNRKLRIELAEAGIAYSQLGIHQPENIAGYYLDTLGRAKQNQYDYYPTYFFEHCRPPEGELVPDYLKSLNWLSACRSGVSAKFTNHLENAALHFPPQITAKQIAELPVWQNGKFDSKVWGAWSDDYAYPKNLLKNTDHKVLEQLTKLATKYESENEILMD